MQAGLRILIGALMVSACASSQPKNEHEGHDHGGHAHGHGHGQSKGDHYEHRFDDPEQWSAVFDAPDRDAWQKPDEVVRLMAIAPGMTVADIGAGTGYFLPHLSRAAGAEGKVLALDIEPKLVAHMEQRAQKEGLANVTARRIAPDDPGLEPGTADRILIVDTWHHIPGRDAYTRKLATQLAPCGALFVVDFTKETTRGPPVEHRIPPEEVKATLEGAGLTAEILEETLPDQYIVRGEETARCEAR